MPNLTTNGPVRIYAQEYQNNINDGHLAIDSSWQLDPASPDGQRILMESEALDTLDSKAVEVYDARNPDTATGLALEGICEVHRIIRQPEAYSTCQILVLGSVGTVIPASSQVKDLSTGYSWMLLNEYTITSGVDLPIFTALEPGNLTVTTTDIWEISTPVFGWTSASDATSLSTGRLVETDDELRVRRFHSVGTSSDNIVDSVYSRLAAVQGVSRLKIYENTGDTPLHGIPSQGIRCVVEGGGESDIVREIYQSVSVGAYIQGDNAVNYTSEVTGNVKTIRYDRPSPVDVYVRVTLNGIGQVTPETLDIIRDSIADYALDLLGIGGDVVAAYLSTPIMNIIGEAALIESGVYPTHIEVAIDNATWTNIVAIDVNELGRIISTNITLE